MTNTAETSAARQGARLPVAEGSADSLCALQESAGFSPNAQESLVRYGFRIGHLSLLVPEGVMTEVLDKPVVYPLPRGPRWLAGMINQRGNVIPLFDLFELSGSTETPPRVRRVLLIGHSVHAVAMYIDELPQALTATDRVAVAASLPGILRSFVEPAFFAQDSHWCEFDYVGFFHHLSADAQGETDEYE